jgi:hypothetical protein
MQGDSHDGEDGHGVVATRWPELLVALLLMAVALLVIIDSLRVGTGWGDDGPRSGYFPFYIGLMLLAASSWIALQQLRRWRVLKVFAERGQLRMVLAVLLPMVLYVAVMAWLGLYLPSALLIAWFMARHGGHRPLVTTLVSLGVPLAFYVVFERWFLVPLPKGPLEALLGVA